MLDQIPNKYLLKIIFSFIPQNKFLHIVKKSKKYQNKLDVSLFAYQNIFLFKKLKINYDTINIDKFTEFISEEFQIKADKNIFPLDLSGKIKTRRLSRMLTAMPRHSVDNHIPAI